ncbi:MAG: hypothetical protein KatS3mg011_0853 [Acidimicrobiia bacterium]|nr:MAG: hypothetical protein KatS3mg011_0853 [Acidimicrobiia bacterium]
MELNRILRILRARWRSLLLLALVGGALAGGITLIVNRSAEPIYQATAPIRFEPAEGQTIADLEQEISEALSVAVFAAQAELTADPTNLIEADAVGGRLLFIAQASTPAEAAAKAEHLRQLYLDLEPTVGEQVDVLLEQLETQAAELEKELDLLQRPLNEAEEELAATHDLLDSQIQALRSQIVQLTVQAVLASPEERPVVEESLAKVRAELERLKAEKEALPPRPSEELPTSEQLQVTALQRRLELLTLEYERLYLRKLGVTGGGVAEPVTFLNLTPSPGSPILNGTAGLLGGFVLALSALVIDARVRQRIWLPVDLSIPVLGELQPRPVTTDVPWYDYAERHPRRLAIQALRTVVEARLGDRPATLAVTGMGAGQVSVHALAADLAASFSSAGWSVLLVDADLAAPSPLPEFRVKGPGLWDVLSIEAGDIEGQRQAASKALDEAIVIKEGLVVMPAGAVVESPADRLAGPHLRVLLEEASRRFDLVVVAGADAEDPSGQILLQRMDAGLLVLEPGKTSASEVEDLVTFLGRGGGRLLGAVMVSRFRPVRARLGPEPAEEPQPPPAKRPRPRPGADGATTSLLERLASAVAVEKAVAAAEERRRQKHAEHPDLASSVTISLDRDEPSTSASEASRTLGEKVLEALTDSDPEDSYETVAEFVVAKVEDVMLASASSGTVSEETAEAMIRLGFAPLHSVRGHPSVGARLAAELRHQLGTRHGQLVEREIARILSSRYRPEQIDLDGWLAREFFERHVARTQRHPVVWHLRSRRGTVQVLVNGRRLDRKRLDLLSTSLVTAVTDALQRQRRAAVRDGNRELVERLDEQLEDAHEFGIALGWLYEGTVPEARIVYPWRPPEQQPRGWSPVWEEGIPAHLAPLQRLGLLAVPVLEDEELLALHP